MNGKYVIMVRQFALRPLYPSAPDADTGDEPQWEAVEYSFSDGCLAPEVESVAVGDFEPVLLEAKIKYGTVYRYEDWNMPWWLAWDSKTSFDDSEKAAAECAFNEFVSGLTEVHAQ